ncbi:hypothetical protein CC1G_08178 [Coprinopsis cinerea okayama7|uniref:Thioesterase domain-containing protein n=1 Tax=Coprinopsis cinerea (strain Okayama-7 / 130 / ATCC MYA-4618 / FGSC 9003) TaxID=240176 RepID=A8NZ76_COPC7|nr:hypothetical protein CC1G_08178 [Coprinopsis cinerea okayama7\|eukprot:XP_001837624.2 hypothetical protein CC1G_08178 [Coprinopsis cinerea okayama7\
MSGNACDGVKWYCWAVFRHFVGESGTWFASSIGTSVRLVEVNLWSTDGNGKPTKAESVFEVVVTKEMCNPFGILHGACAGYLLDYCSVTPLVALGYHNGEDGTGLSQSMNIIYHGAAPIGSKLRIPFFPNKIRRGVLTAVKRDYGASKIVDKCNRFLLRTILGLSYYIVECYRQQQCASGI